MDTSRNAGLVLRFSSPKHRHTSALLSLVQPIFLFTVLLAALGKMCGILPHWSFYLAGMMIIVATTFLPRPKQTFFLVIFLLLCIAVLFLWPQAREGSKLLCNGLFSVSESYNAYRYTKFTINLTQSELTFAQNSAQLILSLVISSVCSLVSNRRRAAILAIFLVLSGFEVYFGVTPGVICNLLIFLVLGLSLALRFSLHQFTENVSGLVLLTVFLIGFATLIAFTAPGVNSQVEQYSEHLRDQLDVAVRTQFPAAVQAVEESFFVRHENPLHAEEANGTDNHSQNYQDYTVNTEYESEISQPDKTRYGKIIWLTFLILALLTLPFVPFILYDTRRRRALMKRLDFDAPNCALAIHAMFLHIMDWLEACGLDIDNRPFSACCGDTAVLLSADYAQRFKVAVYLWLEAEYSDHEMTQIQCAQMQALLDETENTLYQQAGRLKKLKLKYIDCLMV